MAISYNTEYGTGFSAESDDSEQQACEWDAFPSSVLIRLNSRKRRHGARHSLRTPTTRRDYEPRPVMFATHIHGGMRVCPTLFRMSPFVVVATSGPPFNVPTAKDPSATLFKPAPPRSQLARRTLADSQQNRVRCCDLNAEPGEQDRCPHHF